MRLDSSVLEELKDVVNRFPKIRFAALIGSIASKGYSRHDIDIAVKVEGDEKYRILCRFIEELSDALGINEDKLDIIDIDRADLELKRRIISEGITIVGKGYLKGLMAEVSRSYPEHEEYLNLSIREWLAAHDPTSIDLTVIKRRMDFIRSELDFLNDYVLSKGIEEVKSSPILKRLLEGCYQLVVEAIIDVCRHIASAKGWGPAYSSRDFIHECSKHNVIPQRLAKELADCIRLRNIIIHRYLDIDYEQLYKEAERLTRLAKSFEKHLVEFLRRETAVRDTCGRRTAKHTFPPHMRNIDQEEL